MASAMFSEQQAKVLDAILDFVGESSTVAGTGGVLVTGRPEPSWGYQALGASFADCTLLSIAEDHLEWVRERAPREHRPRVLLDVLSSLRDRIDDDVDPASRVALHAPGIGWALAARPDDPVWPTGCRPDPVDSDWVNEQIASGRFENGAGMASGEDGRAMRNLYGLAVRDDEGEVVALAAAFMSYGLHEIGVDVADGHQGLGLGRAVVAAVARQILEREAVAFYSCSPTNIRSMHTALATGFRPVCATASIS